MGVATHPRAPRGSRPTRRHSRYDGGKPRPPGSMPPRRRRTAVINSHAKAARCFLAVLREVLDAQSTGDSDDADSDEPPAHQFAAWSACHTGFYVYDIEQFLTAFNGAGSFSLSKFDSFKRTAKVRGFKYSVWHEDRGKAANCQRWRFHHSPVADSPVFHRAHPENDVLVPRAPTAAKRKRATGATVEFAPAPAAGGPRAGPAAPSSDSDDLAIPQRHRSVSASSPSMSSASSRMSELEAELERLRAENDALRAEVVEAKRSRQEVESDTIRSVVAEVLSSVGAPPAGSSPSLVPEGAVPPELQALLSVEPADDLSFDALHTGDAPMTAGIEDLDSEVGYAGEDESESHRSLPMLPVQLNHAPPGGGGLVLGSARLRHAAGAAGAITADPASPSLDLETEGHSDSGVHVDILLDMDAMLRQDGRPEVGAGHSLQDQSRLQTVSSPGAGSPVDDGASVSDGSMDSDADGPTGLSSSRYEQRLSRITGAGQLQYGAGGSSTQRAVPTVTAQHDGSPRAIGEHSLSRAPVQDSLYRAIDAAGAASPFQNPQLVDAATACADSAPGARAARPLGRAVTFVQHVGDQRRDEPQGGRPSIRLPTQFQADSEPRFGTDWVASPRLATSGSAARTDAAESDALAARDGEPVFAGRLTAAGGVRTLLASDVEPTSAARAAAEIGGGTSAARRVEPISSSRATASGGAHGTLSARDDSVSAVRTDTAGVASSATLRLTSVSAEAQTRFTALAEASAVVEADGQSFRSQARQHTSGATSGPAHSSEVQLGAGLSQTVVFDQDGQQLLRLVPRTDQELRPGAPSGSGGQSTVLSDASEVSVDSFYADDAGAGRSVGAFGVDDSEGTTRSVSRHGAESSLSGRRHRFAVDDNDTVSWMFSTLFTLAVGGMFGEDAAEAASETLAGSSELPSESGLQACSSTDEHSPASRRRADARGASATLLTAQQDTPHDPTRRARAVRALSRNVGRDQVRSAWRLVEWFLRVRSPHPQAARLAQLLFGPQVEHAALHQELRCLLPADHRAARWRSLLPAQTVGARVLSHSTQARPNGPPKGVQGLRGLLPAGNGGPQNAREARPLSALGDASGSATPSVAPRQQLRMTQVALPSTVRWTARSAASQRAHPAQDVNVGFTADTAQQLSAIAQQPKPSRQASECQSSGTNCKFGELVVVAAVLTAFGVPLRTQLRTPRPTARCSAAATPAWEFGVPPLRHTTSPSTGSSFSDPFARDPEFGALSRRIFAGTPFLGLPGVRDARDQAALVVA